MKILRSIFAGLVQRAQQYLSATRPTTDFSYPDSKTLQFYAVTAGGDRTISFPLADAEKTGSTAAILYAAGQQVVTELRLTTPTQK